MSYMNIKKLNEFSLRSLRISAFSALTGSSTQRTQRYAEDAEKIFTCTAARTALSQNFRFRSDGS